jgi:hypothetical protein
MPMVGMKEYDYSPKGIAMAKREAKKTGKKMVVKKVAKKAAAKKKSTMVRKKGM